ncbi:hypothetical protein LSTR_LSTR015956 [Laodelphax striatellus]|uniref:Uncharacterized protein n=1 Tax=Laodelphax striatellus TaxID=195883 RepID=A0A482WRJ4_LAOST|nr:hypothetical protein LSTR_LSTR015956 [Laodelphax striatellus]
MLVTCNKRAGGGGVDSLSVDVTSVGRGLLLTSPLRSSVTGRGTTSETSLATSSETSLTSASRIVVAAPLWRPVTAGRSATG